MAERSPRKNWSRDETLLAFRLYCFTPFGKLHQHNPDIISLAQHLGRSPSAIAMKGCNFASLDPLHQQRGVTGLPNRSQLEDQIWQEFNHDSESIAAEAEALYESLAAPDPDKAADAIGADSLPVPPRDSLKAADAIGADSSLLLPTDLPDNFRGPGGPTEIERTVRTRRVQGFFRRAVLSGYGHRCALTGLAIPEFLNASHIIPWSVCGTAAAPDLASGVASGGRADPANGLCLNALHGRAFDRGLITFDENHRLLVSPALADDTTPDGLGRFAEAFRPETPLTLPERFAPSPEALAYHREAVFQAA